jgi:threonine/homoserine/homoserine lactone efflux protein
VFTFILILLLIAALFGVLGAVLKIALVILLALILAVTVLIWGGWLYLRHRMRTWQREVERRSDEQGRRQRAVDIRYVENEADGERADDRARELTDGGAPGA